MPDLTSYFAGLKKYSEENSGGNNFQPREYDDTGTVLNLTKQSNYGTVLLRPINDVNGIPMKVLSKIYELYESSPAVDENGAPILNKDGTPRYEYSNFIVPDPINFTQAGISLTPEQSMALNNCISAIRKYEDYVNNEVINPEDTATNLGVKFRKEITFFWAKVLSLTANNETSLTDGHIRLIRHNSANFSRNFIQAIDDGTKIRNDGGAWIQDYFSRNVGTSNNIVSITTELNKGGTVGFSMSYMFAQGAQYEITQKDIDVCTDLNTQLVDLTNFDVSVINAITNRINGYIIAADRKVASDTGAQAAATPAYTTIDPSQVVQAQTQPVVNTTTIPNPNVTTNTINTPNVSVGTIPTPVVDASNPNVIPTPVATTLTAGTIPTPGTPVNPVMPNVGNVVNPSVVNPTTPVMPSFGTMQPVNGTNL